MLQGKPPKEAWRAGAAAAAEGAWRRETPASGEAGERKTKSFWALLVVKPGSQIFYFYCNWLWQSLVAASSEQAFLGMIVETRITYVVCNANSLDKKIVVL